MLRNLLKYLFTCVVCSSMAQVMPNIGQFQKHQLVYNPAYSGSSTGLKVNLLHRDQFQGVEGAPNTQALTMDAPVVNSLGAGLSFIRHSIGGVNQIDFNTNASYRIKLDQNAFLQLGLKIGYSQFSFNFSDVKVWEENDPYLDAYSNGGVLRFGAGAYFKRKDLYVGISAPDIQSADMGNVFANSIDGKSLIKQNFILMAGSKFVINEFVSFVPDLMLRYYTGGSLNTFMNLGLELNQTVTTGFNMSLPLSYGVFAMVRISPKVRLGYQYEFNTSSSVLGQFRTNEFTVSYGFQ